MGALNMECKRENKRSTGRRWASDCILVPFVEPEKKVPLNHDTHAHACRYLDYSREW